MAGPKSTKLCECGCGMLTNIAKRARKTFGVEKGQPSRFLPGHSAMVAKQHFLAKPRKVRPRAYSSWRAMRERCNNPNFAQYSDYGGRGIRVCERWNSFANFLVDMGERPPGHTIEREQVNGNYEPSNCVWKLLREQMSNMRSNVRLTLNGKTQHVAAWARELGISPYTIHDRLKRGLPAEAALRVTRPAAASEPPA